MPDAQIPRSSHGPWEVERNRHGVMFSGPLEVGDCIRVVLAEPTDEMVERAGQAIHGHACGCAHEPWPLNANYREMARAALEAAFSTSRVPTPWPMRITTLRELAEALTGVAEDARLDAHDLRTAAAAPVGRRTDFVMLKLLTIRLQELVG